MTSFLLVVFDGLRPDMVGPDTTPNLLRFAALGTRFTRARSVFPSETRVCSSTVATGCLPRRHGLVANRIGHPTDPSRSVDTGQVENLRALQDEIGAPVLEMPTLGEILAASGRDCAILSSGTTGQTFLLNPQADALGQLTLSAHGPHACSAAGRSLLATLDAPPSAPLDRAIWIAETFRTRLLPEPPAATILWLCEPDTSGHYAGLGSEGQLDALRRVDAAFGRILDDWQAGPQRDRLQIMVASDHGHATIGGLHDVGASLATQDAFSGCTLLPGSSGGIIVPGGDAERIGTLAQYLTTQDWAGAVFAVETGELPPGVLPRSALLADHARGAHVLFTLRASKHRAPSGLPGTTLYDGGLAVGAGTHGGLLAAELHIVMMLAGSAIEAASLSDWPCGLTDIAPTVLALLGVAGASEMDGRVLSEALMADQDPVQSVSPETWEAHAPGYTQRLARTRLGSQIYLDAGYRS